MNEKASVFYERVNESNFKEPMLRLQMAVSSTARGEMDQLWKILFQPQGAGGQNLEQLDQWMARNPSLMKTMSGGSSDMLRSLAAQKGTAQGLDKEAARATAEVKKAFGVNQLPLQELESLELKSKSSGAVLDGFASCLRRASQKLGAIFIPGAREALAELDRILTNPDLGAAERHRGFADWSAAHPHLASMVRSSDTQGLLVDQARTGSFTDQEYLKARGAVIRAFDPAFST